MRRRNRTTESLLVEAAFVATHDVCCRTGSAGCTVIMTAHAYCLIAVGVVHGLTLLLWQQVHPADRRVLASTARRLPALAASVAWACGAALSWLVASAVLWGWDALDAVLWEVQRSGAPRRVPATAEHVELVAWEMDRINGWLRGQTVPVEEEDEWDDPREEEYGDPVGVRREAA